MKTLSVVCIFIFTTQAYGQNVNISYSPSSVNGWGKMPKVSMTSVGIEFTTNYWFLEYIEAGFVHANHHYQGYIGPNAKKNGKIPAELASKINDSLGLYILPINFIVEPLFLHIEFSAGMAYFIHQIPTVKGRHLNVMFRGLVSVEIIKNLSIGLSYNHISNAWTGNVNPGYDFPALTLQLGLRSW